MPYSRDNKQFKVNNVKYLNKDFSNLKNSLVEYAKSYFPNTYKDFNETSPGMMLLEMSAYVGDVLSFYIDQQYREMLLPLAEERRNVVNLAKVLGYKVKPISPAYVELEFTQTVAADVTDIDNIKPNYGQAFTLNAGQQVKAASDSTIIFETLDVVDFKVSGSYKGDGVESSAVDSNTGLTSEYTIKRTVRGLSGETKTKTFAIGAPEKFTKLQLPELNVIDIVSVKDSNNNTWYEVDYLAQDRVPVSTHYLDDVNRETAYSSVAPHITTTPIPVPYSLIYIRTSKRFIVEFEESKTSLVFGNGVIRSGQTLENDFFESEQVGLTLPGSQENLTNTIDPLMGDNFSTLGETPAHTTLTVTYRTGGGLAANVPTGDLISLGTINLAAGSNNNSLSVTNSMPAAGGSGAETIEEVRERASAYFASQNRCVTRDDYKARVFNMPGKYGNLAKVFVDKINSIETDTGDILNIDLSEAAGMLAEQIQLSDINQDGSVDIADVVLLINEVLLGEGSTVINQFNINELKQAIAIYHLSYDNNKRLLETPRIIQSNLSNYLEEFRILTDDISLHNGKIINFGVLFDVTAAHTANKQEVKLRCIQKIIDYFKIDNMQFRQPINTNDLSYEIMGVDGVRSVNHITLTQNYDWGQMGQDSILDTTPTFSPGLYATVYDTGTGDWSSDTDNNSGQAGYGYFYDFQQFYGGNPALEKGFILPSVEPAVFELKNPRENVKGVVR